MPSLGVRSPWVAVSFIYQLVIISYIGSVEQMYVPTSISLPPINKEIFTYQVSHYIYQLQNIQTAFLLKIRSANFHNVSLKLFLSLINILDSNSNINFHCHVIY